MIGPGINPLWIPRNNLYPYISTFLSACLSVYLSIIYSFCFSGGLWLIQSPIRLPPLLVDILIRPYVMEWCNYLLHVHWRNMKPLEIKKTKKQHYLSNLEFNQSILSSISHVPSQLTMAPIILIPPVCCPHYLLMVNHQTAPRTHRFPSLPS